MHAESGYIVPSVLDPKKIKDLNFPIVAKPDNAHSGLGIKVFKNEEDLKDAELTEFSSFSEKIKIKEKRRCQFKNNVSSYCRSSPSSGQGSN